MKDAEDALSGHRVRNEGRELRGHLVGAVSNTWRRPRTKAVRNEIRMEEIRGKT